MANQLLIPRPSSRDDGELHLELKSSINESLLRSLLNNVRDALFPEKLPPLHLTSKPVRVREIWGEYDNRKKGAAGTFVVHTALIAGLIAASVVGHKVVQAIEKPKVTIVAPELSDYMPVTAPNKVAMGGGGGGGDRDKLQAPKGKLPRASLATPLTPPAVVLRNPNPKLTAEPTVVLPPNIHLPNQNMPNLGDPLAKVSGPPSNGTGSGGGIGSGTGGGVGSGTGPGVGPGRGGGYGGGVFRVGGGVSAPKAIWAPDPEYSEEARKAKYQGVCVLWLIVGADGHPRDVRVARTLGMGLDEKAIEAVKQWKFEPATKDGKPVAVQINVEVNFRLY